MQHRETPSERIQRWSHLVPAGAPVRFVQRIAAARKVATADAPTRHLLPSFTSAPLVRMPFYRFALRT